MKHKSKARKYRVLCTVRSKDGTAPDVRTIGGDTVFIHLREGMTAQWRLMKVPARKKSE